MVGAVAGIPVPTERRATLDVCVDFEQIGGVGLGGIMRGEGEQRSSTSVDNLTPHRRCGLGKKRSERRRSAASG